MKFGDEEVVNRNYPVPEDTIIVIPFKGFDVNKTDTFLAPMERKRKWFTKEFYQCLPLTIANQMGFSVSVPYDFTVSWNGGPSNDDLVIGYTDDKETLEKDTHVSIVKHFGNGIFTLSLPVMLRTPPSVNLLVVPATNYCHPTLTAMSGVVESDNLRYIFTVNIKVTVPNATTHVSKNIPLATIIPIPRNFAENFSVVDGKSVIPSSVIDKEEQAYYDQQALRWTLDGVDRLYFSGQDVYGNKFKDHQLP